MLSHRYAALVRRRGLILAALALALVLSFLLDIATGPSRFPLADVIGGLFDPASLSRARAVILWDVRLPQASMAIVAGAALGLAGAEMQTMLNNPLASPGTLGIAAAAAFGASLAIVFDFGRFGLNPYLAVPLSAFVCAAAAILLINLLARVYGAGIDTIVLFGIALHFAVTALEWTVQFVAEASALQEIVFWTMGSLGRASWGKIAIVTAAVLICLPLSLRRAWVMTALRGGEDQARALGIAVERVRLIVLLRASLLAATAVAFVGAIGFVGLVGPHIARLALGEDHRFFLPGSALAGAVVLSGASVAAKSVIPGLVLPVGIVTALIGIPLFMGLILSRRRLP